jgi:hypothetical protein
MWLLILEAAAAFFLLAFIVWWTMFSGRKSELAQNAEKSQVSMQDDDIHGQNQDRRSNPDR